MGWVRYGCGVVHGVHPALEIYRSKLRNIFLIRLTILMRRHIAYCLHGELEYRVALLPGCQIIQKGKPSGLS